MVLVFDFGCATYFDCATDLSCGLRFVVVLHILIVLQIYGVGYILSDFGCASNFVMWAEMLQIYVYGLQSFMGSDLCVRASKLYGLKFMCIGFNVVWQHKRKKKLLNSKMKKGQN